MIVGNLYWLAALDEIRIKRARLTQVANKKKENLSPALIVIYVIFVCFITGYLLYVSCYILNAFELYQIVLNRLINTIFC